MIFFPLLIKKTAHPDSETSVR